MKGSLFYNMMMHELLNDSISWFLCWAIEFTISFHLHDITGHQILIFSYLIKLRPFSCLFKCSGSCNLRFHIFISCTAIYWSQGCALIDLFYNSQHELMITISHFHDPQHHTNSNNYSLGPAASRIYWAHYSWAWAYCFILPIKHKHQVLHQILDYSAYGLSVGCGYCILV